MVRAFKHTSLACTVEFARLQKESLAFIHSNSEPNKYISLKTIQEVPVIDNVQAPLLPNPLTNIQPNLLPIPLAKTTTIPLAKFHPKNIKNSGHIPADVRSEKPETRLMLFVRSTL